MSKVVRSRRGFLLGAMMTPVAAALSACARAAENPKPANVDIENFSSAGKSLGKTSVARVVKSEEEWRKQLSPESFTVARHEGTERPYSGKYNDNHADGLYRCICCDTALFDSRAKYLHFVWHLFVLAGTACHFFAALWYSAPAA